MEFKILLINRNHESNLHNQRTIIPAIKGRGSLVFISPKVSKVQYSRACEDILRKGGSNA